MLRGSRSRRWQSTASQAGMLKASYPSGGSTLPSYTDFAEMTGMVLLSKTPLHDSPNAVFVVLGGGDEEPFDLVIRCVRAFFREALPQLLGGSVVSHHYLSSQGRGERGHFPY